MGILSSILGNGSIIEKTLGLIDNMHDSGVEIIEAKTKAKTDLLSAYAPFKVAQRLLALIFAATFVSSYILVMVMVLRGMNADEVTAVITAFKIDWIMMTIIVFYFGGGALEGVVRQVKKPKEK